MDAKRWRSVCVVGAACLAAGAAGCSDDGTRASPSTSSSTTGVPVSTTTEPATTTTEALPTAFGSPTAAATALFKAWSTNDRVGADERHLAPRAELDKLFAKPALKGARLRTCDDGAFGKASCFFGNGQGGVDITLLPAGKGWSISLIEAY